MGCGGAKAANGQAGDAYGAKRLQMRPRYTLAHLPPDEKMREKDRLMARIEMKRIEFRPAQVAFNDEAAELLQDIAEALMDYPEFEVVVEGYAGRQDAKKVKEDPKQLAAVRADTCRAKLSAFGVISDIRTVSQGLDSRSDCGYVVILPGQAKLLEPQQRLDMILSRYSFEFGPQTAEMSAKGQRVANVMARVMKETRNRTLITVPKKSSPLAIKRAEAIAQAIRDTGVASEIMVKIATNNQDRATVTIDGNGNDYGRGGMDSPQLVLTEILRETPLAFRPNSANLVPDVLPVVKRLAEVLKQVQYMTCIVEAYSGNIPTNVGSSDLRMIRMIMTERAQRVIDIFQNEGVTVPVYAKGHSGASSDSSLGKGPRVVITLVNQGEEELDPIEVTENDYGGCIHMGCMWEGDESF